MRRRRLLFVIVALVFAASFVRVGYEPLGWGGYWWVDVGVPWRR